MRSPGSSTSNPGEDVPEEGGDALAECREALARKAISFPLVVKPRWGVSSIGTYFPEDLEELELSCRLSEPCFARTITGERLFRFRQQPFAEGDNLRQFRDCLRTDDPIRVRRRHGGIKWAHETAADQVPCGKRGARERDALSIDRRIDRHACVIENRTARRVHALNAGKVEPLAPTLPLADVQKRESAEIRGRPEPIAAIKKLRTADWKQLFRAEANDVESGGGSVAVANAKIDVLAREVDMLRGRTDPEIDLGVNLGEAAQSMHEPLRCKIRRGGDSKCAAALALQ